MARFTLALLVLLSLAACDTATTTPAPRTGLVFVGEPRVVNDPNLFRVEGVVRNTADRPYSAFVKVTLFDEGGKIVGTYTGAVNDVQPGEEATYTALGLDTPAAWARVQARIDSQIAH